MNLFDKDNFDISLGLCICNIPDSYVESRFSRKITKIFKEQAPIDIDELLPDEFFNWDEIGIK